VVTTPKLDGAENFPYRYGINSLLRNNRGQNFLEAEFILGIEFVSNLAERHPIHWVKVKLNGTVSHRDGLRVTVHVFAGGLELTKYNDGKSGYLAQSSLPLYFGLGDAQKVGHIDIDWPTDARQRITQNLRTNTVLQFTEPK